MRLFSLILFTSLLLQLWMPWWTIMAVPFVFCLWKCRTPGRAFLMSFLAVFLLWGLASLFIHIRSGGILSERVSILLGIGNPLLLILITAFTGGLAAGLAGWAGWECRKLFRQR
ncbi:hypothetical protein EDD80_101600 [Anseongella ginsenosidimutans]|uniref:Uncharacterized protein n=1 Tax=Anseongella ginsenosidimutans TaxID=496056 RepID=A0A4R3L0G5_9SPHI|nr:hypothetical protein [Anseongella ginsenosidimutans]QEC50957.1 hypothetical protein FRZ59_00360 [Anseongella ginsenosidimutans]TCS90400.1 hypothetical protein EDD80_101600 [Anseongella ginsenosidimutans]